MPELVALCPAVGLEVLTQITKPVVGRLILKAPFISKAAKALPLPLALRKLFQPKSTKTKVQKAYDGQHVVKVSDAVEAVESELNSLLGLSELGEGFIKVLGIPPPDTTTGGAAPLGPTDRIVKKIREAALRHDTPRKEGTKIGYFRPAKGHGHGRRGAP